MCEHILLSMKRMALVFSAFLCIINNNNIIYPVLKICYCNINTESIGIGLKYWREVNLFIVI